MVAQKNATHPGSQKVPRWPPYGIPLAAICNPVGRHMQSRRPPYAISPAAIWNPAGRQVPAGMNNRLSDNECWMLQMETSILIVVPTVEKI